MDLAIRAREQGGLSLGQKCNHLRELRRKHGALDREVQKLGCTPGGDQIKLTKLKKKKLQLKEEIARLEADQKAETESSASLPLAAE